MGSLRGADWRGVDFPTLIGLALEEVDASDPQTVLGDKIGVTQGTISKWQNGLRTPNRAIWRRISEVIDQPYEVVSAAVGRTVLVRPPTVSVQLRDCQEQLAVLTKENARLRRQLQSGR